MALSLREYLTNVDRKEYTEHKLAAATKRDSLCQRFPIEGWPTMPLERYALGTPESEDSFCYAMEYGSHELGRLAGPSGKSLIFYKKETTEWKFDTKTYKTEEDAWTAIRAAFVKALQLGTEGKFADVDEIPELRGARVLRAKLLSIYFPKAILPVFSRVHLLRFLELLGATVPPGDVRKTVTLGLMLSEKLRELPELRDWSNDELMALLYRWNPPGDEPTLLKIAPGEGAKYWDSDCLPRGIICVGWEDVGDLRAYKDYDAFREAFDDAYSAGYNGHQGTITRKAKELWALSELEEGDFIAANRGTKEILAVGEVVSPGYVWEANRSEFNHTVKVRWDLNRSGFIEPVKKWVNVTVDNLTGDLRKTILALRRNAEPLPSGTDIIQILTPLTMSATNRIYYGPPGTGKTFALQKIFRDYTDEGAGQDRKTWLLGLVADCRWRDVISAVLAEKGPLAAPAIRDHDLVQAMLAKSGASTTQMIKNCLKHHTPPDLETVKTERRGEPVIFTKSAESIWSLLPDWEQEEERLTAFVKKYLAGPSIKTPTKRYRTATFHPSYCYEDFVRGIRPVGTEDEGRTEFRMADGVFKQICDEARANPTKRYALFIDEINRGNIAKIFGELITLIEPDKRITVANDGTVTGGMTVQLPGSNTGEVAEPPFGVPANLDLYGTMNTADRSIALLDIALRRRFEFFEMPPRYDALVFSAPVADVDRGALLRRINDRLEYLLDRDHRIGHAYLMKAQSLADLRAAFANQIIPLLQEYFFDDLGKVALVLSGSGGRSAFVRKEELRHADLFPGDSSRTTTNVRHRYLVSEPGSWLPQHFQEIYASTPASEPASEETEA